MKRTQVIATTALITVGAAALTIYLLKKRQTQKRKEFVANAGYEMAYDLHFPVKYRRPDSKNGHSHAAF